MRFIHQLLLTITISACAQLSLFAMDSLEIDIDTLKLFIKKELRQTPGLREALFNHELPTHKDIFITIRLIRNECKLKGFSKTVANQIVAAYIASDFKLIMEDFKNLLAKLKEETATVKTK